MPHTGFPKARRGQFVLVERRCSSMNLKTGNHEWLEYQPGIVSSVARDGEAKEVRVHGSAPLRWDTRGWNYLYLDGGGVVRDPKAVCAMLVDEFGASLVFATREEAVAAIRKASGL
jgi:hypothetical protein